MSRTVSKSRRATSISDTITLPRSEYERLLAAAGERAPRSAPPLPKPDADGNFPAIEYIRASIARQLLRGRAVAGLTQSQLARRAGVRQETISRIESAKHTVTAAVMAKIERALKKPGHASRPRTTRRS